MEEVEVDNKWGYEEIALEELVTEPDETQLLIVALLMRLYDVNMALLREVNEERALEIYTEHNAGGNFNPTMYVPDLTSAESNLGAVEDIDEEVEND